MRRRLPWLLGATLSVAGCLVACGPQGGSAAAGETAAGAGKTAAQQPGGKENQVVVIKTSKGEIRVELETARAPLTVRNFLAYADDGFFDGTIFHRVIDGFMIQGGGFAADMRQKQTRDPIKNEADNGLKNARGTLAMARTSVVDSATAQFFINLVDNDASEPRPARLRLRGVRPRGRRHGRGGRDRQGAHRPQRRLPGRARGPGDHRVDQARALRGAPAARP